MGRCSATGELIKDFATGRDVMDSDDEQIRQSMERLLVEKYGFNAGDLDIDRWFDMELDGERHRGMADLIVHVKGRPFMHIYCHRGSIVTREFEALAASRLAYDEQIPYTVVTNGLEAEFINTLTGKVIGEGLESIPDHGRALELFVETEFLPLEEKRREKNTRIYMAYAVFECTNFCSG